MYDQSGEELSPSDRVAPPVADARRLEDEIFNLRADDDDAFDSLRNRVADFQRANLPFYDNFCRSVAMDPAYLPVEAYSLTRVATFPESSDEAVFESSGTTGKRRSRHHVRSLALYARAVTTGFSHHFGDGPFTFRALLPEYSEQGERSSLVTMARILVDAFGDEQSGFVLDDPTVLRQPEPQAAVRNPVVVLGAAFGLVDLVAQGGGGGLSKADIVIETGGMKTHRREMTRALLHETIMRGFNVAASQVWSEYGMCEMMSQCYMHGNSTFVCPPWVRFDVVDADDPAKSKEAGQEGRLAFVDLANLYTVSALLTGDRAVRSGSGFEVLGRISGQDLRGCNFLLEAAAQATEPEAAAS